MVGKLFPYPEPEMRVLFEISEILFPICEIIFLISENLFPARTCHCFFSDIRNNRLKRNSTCHTKNQFALRVTHSDSKLFLLPLVGIENNRKTFGFLRLHGLYVFYITLLLLKLKRIGLCRVCDLVTDQFLMCTFNPKITVVIQYSCCL